MTLIHPLKYSWGLNEHRFNVWGGYDTIEEARDAIKADILKDREFLSEFRVYEYVIVPQTVAKVFDSALDK